MRAVCSKDVHTDSVYLVDIMIFEYISFCLRLNIKEAKTSVFELHAHHRAHTSQSLTQAVEVFPVLATLLSAFSKIKSHFLSHLKHSVPFIIHFMYIHTLLGPSRVKARCSPPTQPPGTNFTRDQGELFVEN